jgi:hypothetical protein
MALITKRPKEETIKKYALRDLQSQALSGSNTAEIWLQYADHRFAAHKTTRCHQISSENTRSYNSRTACFSSIESGRRRAMQKLFRADWTIGRFALKRKLRSYTNTCLLRRLVVLLEILFILAYK